MKRTHRVVALLVITALIAVMVVMSSTISAFGQEAKAGSATAKAGAAKAGKAEAKAGGDPPPEPEPEE